MSNQDRTELEQLLTEFGDQVDGQIETPPLTYFEQLVSETVSRQEATAAETAGFVALAAAILSVLTLLLRAGLILPVAILFGGLFLLLPAVLLLYVPNLIEAGGVPGAGE